MDGIKKLLKPLASLYLTVVLLLLSMLLVYAGTTVQKQMSIQDVQKQFFHSWFAWVPLDPLLRPFSQAGIGSKIPGGFWMPGGFTFIGLLLLNLLAAHSVRFKLNWKRSGIILIHLGLIVMLSGEILTNMLAVESMMTIDEGQTVNYTADLRHVELAVIDTSPADHDNVTVVDDKLLKPGAIIQAPALPFRIRVDEYYPNSSLVGPMMERPGAVQKQTTGLNKALRIAPEPKIAGNNADGAVDMASAFVTILAGDRAVGTYLVSQWNQEPELRDFIKPEPVTVDGKTYTLDLRFRRYYKPYSVTLTKFSHDLYPGTDEPSNFASMVRLVDPSSHEDREVKIWMNHPLTYHGETFYQQNFKNHDRTTVLQVTHNPGWMLPYLGLGLGLFGMLVHFGMHLTGFLRRRLAVASGGPRSVPQATGKKSKGSRPQAALTQYTLQPKTNWLGRLTMVVGAIIAIVLVAGALATPEVEANGCNLTAFGKLPVMTGGRVMPLESLARDTLRVLCGKETFKDNEGSTQPAIRWLADTMAELPAASDYRVIRIDYPDILSQLGLDPERKLFSIAELRQHGDTVTAQFEMIRDIPDKERNIYQKRIAELFEHLAIYVDVQSKASLMMVPPAKEGQGWPTLYRIDPKGRPLGRRLGAEQFWNVLETYNAGHSAEFNTAVADYRTSLAQRFPTTMAKVDYESFFDRFGPFFLCLWLYGLVFVLACFSWLGLRRAFLGAAVGVLVITLLVHTFGLISRIYLTGRPPVTNLYSSALFIAWAAVLLSLVLELIFKNGLGAAVASIMGFASLLIAHYLGAAGDTMKPVVAVLATNFWLWTHVPCVTLGYASTILSGMIAVVYVVLGVFTPLLNEKLTPDEPIGKALTRMVYGITCFAILFSFVGTILGGIWADYSWGRFWGWDPKENGAILIVLWNAIILHARWGGIVRQRGTMVLAILGIIVTSWSWFGTNLLGVGLHAYGFIDGWAQTLVACWCGTLGMVGLGLLPQRWWRSFAQPKIE